MKKEEIKDIVYRAIREIAGTEDPFRFAVHDDMCYDIAVRAVEIAMWEETKPITASMREVAKLSLELGQHHYRGIRIDTKEWVSGFLVIAPQIPPCWPPILDKTSGPWCNYYYIIKWEDNVEQYFRVYPESVGRCTGLTDKNGAKIFEGDVLYPINKRPYLVFWQEEEVKFALKNSRGFCLNIYQNIADEYIVIGNIHDNPELLKVGEE
jgi:hypothetical protein